MLRRFRWLALLFFLTAACTTGQRTTRTLVVGDGIAGDVQDVQSGCDYSYAQEHRRVGGGIGVRRTMAEGPVYGGHARIASARPVFNEEFPGSFDRRRYEIWDAGVMGGYYWDHAGFELGVSGMKSSLSEGVLPIGSLRLLFGAPGVAWFDLELGSQDPVYFTNIASIGAGMEGEGFRFRGGLTAYGVPIDDSSPDGGLVLGSADDIFDSGAFLDGHIWNGRYGIVGGVVVGSNVMGRLGFSVALE